MSAYRFCRSDDIPLLVDALNRCWSPYFPDEPPMTPAAFKRSIRDLQVWCSSCMVAFSGSDPIGVLIGAKRASGTLVHKIAVHPDHRRQGHGRHLLASLGSKLAILGPPRMVAEVPETLAPACALFSASGYVQESLLTDYVLQGEENDRPRRMEGRFVIPVTVDDLAANGLLGEADPQVCWERSVETLTARKDDIAGLAVASDERIEAYRSVHGGRPDGGDSVAPLCCRRRRSPPEAIALSTQRARYEDAPVPEGPPVGDLQGVAGDARFPLRRRVSTLRSEGAVVRTFQTRFAPASISKVVW